MWRIKDMKKIDKLIFLLGGEQINKVKNAMLASELYRFENNIYLSISYDKREDVKEVHLGRLFLMKDFFPRLIVLDEFEELLKSAKEIGLDVTYALPYRMLSFEQVLENVVCNLKIVLENYAELYEISKVELEKKQKLIKNYLIKDISGCSIEEIEKEVSNQIYKPKLAVADAKKLNSFEQKRKKESDEFKEKYNIPKNIYTLFEYEQLKKKKKMGARFVSCLALQIFAIAIFIAGLINNQSFSGTEDIYFGFLCIFLSYIGLCFVTGTRFEQMNLLEPLVVFFVAFVAIEKLQLQSADLVLIWTIVVGTVVSVPLIICEIVVPIKKRKQATLKYNEKYLAEYGSVKESTDCRDYLPSLLYLETGRYASIVRFSQSQYAIAIKGVVCFKKIKTNEVIIDYIEKECDYQEAIETALYMLEKNNELFIFRD